MTRRDDTADALKVKSSESTWPPFHLAFTALLVSIGGGFNFGYQLLITNPAQEAFIQFLNVSYTEYHGVQNDRKTVEFIWGVVVSSFFWGATVGALLIQATADNLGRKNGILLTFIVQIASLTSEIISYFISCYIMYSISRIILGIAISVCLGIGPMFIIECSPVARRGMISMATGIMLQLGIVVGSISAMPEIWGTVDLWWLIYALQLGVTVAITLFMFLLPESPSFLAAQKKTDLAERSFIYYHGIDISEAKLLLEQFQTENKNDQSIGLFEIFRDKKWLCGFILSAVVMGGTILSGVAVVNAFTFEILLSVGLNAFQASIANVVICIMALIGALLSGRLVEQLGRRPLILSTFSALVAVNLIFAGLMYLFKWTAEKWCGWCVVLAICLFNLVFSAGPGPVCFLVPGELVGQEARAATYTWVTIILNGVRSLILAIYFPIRAYLDVSLSYLLLFIPPCLVTLVICYYWLPETAGKSPEEVRDTMETRLRSTRTTGKNVSFGGIVMQSLLSKE